MKSYDQRIFLPSIVLFRDIDIIGHRDVKFIIVE